MQCTSSDTSAPDPKKRKVAHPTYQKWKTELDHDCQTVAWLDCDTELSGIVSKFRCTVCTKFKANIESRRNFSEKWLLGVESVRTSNIRDHAKADQQVQAMNLLKREHARASGSDVTSYAPIARALNRLTDNERDQLRHKFDISYFLASEKISFRKYPQLCELEARHGVAIGSTYTNEVACKTFTHYIAESRRLEMFDKLKQAKFFSLLIDGSTDKGNADDEVFMAVWCDGKGSDEKVHTRTTYLHGQKLLMRVDYFWLSKMHC